MSHSAIAIRLLLAAALLLAPQGIALARSDGDSIQAQEAAEASRYTTRSTAIGIGSTNRLETYLSPLEYKGPELRFLHESMRMTKMMRGRISTQQFFEGNISRTHSPTHDAHYLSGDFDWRIGWHYNWKLMPQLRILAGLQTGASIGVVYNTRNGNNPAQGKLSTDIAASAVAIWHVRLLHRQIALRYQMDMPLMGLMFSPAYGQSYYEIFSLKEYDSNVCFTWPFNAPTFHSLLSADVPFKLGTLRLAWRCDIRQSHVNHLKSHTWSNIFMIGFVKHFKLVKHNDSDASKYIF